MKRPRDDAMRLYLETHRDRYSATSHKPVMDLTGVLIGLAITGLFLAVLLGLVR